VEFEKDLLFLYLIFRITVTVGHWLCDKPDGELKEADLGVFKVTKTTYKIMTVKYLYFDFDFYIYFDFC
jgi:hypothetical protein